MTMAMELIRHIAGLYSGKAIKGDFTQIYITGHEIWMAQQILASQDQADGAQGERERFEVEMLDLGLPIERDSHGAYVSDHVRHLWSGWELRAALAQPSMVPELGVPLDATHYLPGAPENRKYRREIDGVWHEFCGKRWLPLDHGTPETYLPVHSPAPGMERPEVVAWLVTGVHPNHSAPHAAVDRNGQSARALADHWAERGCAVEIMPLMTVAQHARAVAKWADLFNRAQDSADAALAKVPELERPEALDFKPCHHHAEKIRQRVEEAASVYEAGQSALGYMEDIAESALVLRNGLDLLSAQHERIVGALRNELESERDLAKVLQEQNDALRSTAEVAQARVAELIAALERAATSMWNSEANMDNAAAEAEEAIGNAKSSAPVAQAGQVPDGCAPGTYAIDYLDNWDGEGDRYFCIAEKTADGKWIRHESGQELLEYKGDAILAAWLLAASEAQECDK